MPPPDSWNLVPALRGPRFALADLVGAYDALLDLAASAAPPGRPAGRRGDEGDGDDEGGVDAGEEGGGGGERPAKRRKEDTGGGEPSAAIPSCSPDLYRNLQLVSALLLRTAAPCSPSGNGPRRGAGGTGSRERGTGVPALLTEAQASAVRRTMERSGAVLERLSPRSAPRHKAKSGGDTGEPPLLSPDRLVVEPAGASDDDDNNSDSDDGREAYFCWRYDDDDGRGSNDIATDARAAAITAATAIDVSALADRRSLAAEEAELWRMALAPTPDEGR
jgi:hypothetical protein